MDAQDFQQEIAAFLGTPVSGAPSSGIPVFGSLALAGVLAGTGYLIYKAL